MKGRFTYEMPSPTATALVGLSHRGSRLECHAAAAMRQPYGGPMGVFAEFPNSGAAGISICNAEKGLHNRKKANTFAAESICQRHGSQSLQTGLQIPILGTSGLQIRWNEARRMKW